MKRFNKWSRMCLAATVIATLVGPELSAQVRKAEPPSAAKGAPGNAPPGKDAIDPRDNRLDIIDMSAPSTIDARQPIEVAVTAADKRGIGFVKLQLGEDVRWLNADGRQIASFVQSFETRQSGVATILATAISTDGRTPGPTRSLTVVLIDQVKADRIDLTPIKDVDPSYVLGIGGVIANPNLKRAPDPWWPEYIKAQAHPFDWQANCPGVNAVTPEGGVLRCWLGLHPEVRAHLIWQLPKYTTYDEWGTLKGEPDPITYDNWNAFQKGLLDSAFYHYYNYLKSGAQSFGGPVIPDLPVNLINNTDDQGAMTFFSEFDAIRLYMHTVGHSLALEIGGFLPWSVTSYNDDDLDLLFNTKYIVAFQYVYFNEAKGFRSHTGYGPPTHQIFPATPLTTFQFLLANNMILPTQLSSVGKLLEWGRIHQIHESSYSGSPLEKFETLQKQAVWQYRGLTPASRMMELTVFKDPFTNLQYDPAAWTPEGCHGASSFLQFALRAANIPVSREYLVGQDGHETAVFRTLGMALTHGDDVYGMRWAESVPLAPGYAPLVSIATLNAWFKAPNLPDPYYNLGRGVLEAAVKYLSNDFLKRYCADKAANVSHANGTVFAEFIEYYTKIPWYTVQQLEAMNFWNDLGAKAAKLNLCQ